MIPSRMCAVCRRRREKSELLRIAKYKDGTFKVDLDGKAEGRGAYICKDGDCIKNAISKNTLSRSFKGRIDDGIYAELSEIYNGNKN